MSNVAYTAELAFLDLFFCIILFYLKRIIIKKGSDRMAENTNDSQVG